ncbi:MAG: phospho-sugar mutase [Jatrophihabitans sp.]
MPDEELRGRVRAWIDDDVDSAAASELRELLAAGADAALAERFRGPLTFGTAGLRGQLRAGPNGMNRAVVRRAAAGLTAWLRQRAASGERIVVGYDGRHESAEFARESAAIFAAAGFESRLMPRPLPTPLLAFAVQHLQAAAGVMVTASHNPRQDNGYKVYAADGAQIAPPADAEIAAAIRAVGSTREVPLDYQGFLVIDEAVIDSYVAAVAGLADDGPRDLRVVHTALHGVGTELAVKVFAAAGFAPLITVAQQADPDPDFPTVAFPNPEEPGVLDLALALARDQDADLVLANDPDADRCAVAVACSGRWRLLSGDDVGVLLADALLRRGIRDTYATTIVSSSMLRVMAERHGAGYAETLTGFKWISRAAPDLAYGYEEALGYAVAPGLVRDKDGISAALLVAELAAQLKQQGSSLPQRLDELAAEYGRHATGQLSIRVADPADLDRSMSRLRARPPTELLGEPVTVTDLRPDADVLRWTWPGGRIVIRPSGTEPKLKAYLEVVGAAGQPAQLADAQLERLRAQLADVLGS